MGVFSTEALDCRTGQNKGRYCKKELLLLLVSLPLLYPSYYTYRTFNTFNRNYRVIKISLGIFYPSIQIIAKACVSLASTRWEKRASSLLSWFFIKYL